MRLKYTTRFKKSFKDFPREIRNKFYKQANYLLCDFRHSSLQVKKYNKIKNIWQARVDKNIRFYFLIENDNYILLDIKKHPK